MVATAAGATASAPAASAIVGIRIVVPATIWASGDSPFAAANERVVMLFIAASCQSVSPGATVWTTAA